jgi:5-methylcytosine-specific restriction endonuclease McrA
MAKSKKEKKPKKWVLRPLAISALKKIFVRSPMFQVVKKMNRRPRTVINKDGSESTALRWEYQCQHCEQWFAEKINKEVQIQIDHVLPVTDPETGWVGIEDWIEREFVDVEVYDPKEETDKQLYDRIKSRLQILCLSCHNIKSQKENTRRREVKKEKTPPQKKSKK